MSLLHSLHRNVKTIAMPMGMVVGALLCRPVTAAESMSNGMITPTVIFLMLFFSFCRVKPRQLRVKMLHVWLLAFQIVGSIVVYLSFVWFDPLLAQGAMICVLAPVAMAAVVIGGMLGANVTTMATYSLICNMVVALVAPMLLSFVGSDHATFLAILSRVGPVLVLPFVCAQLCRKFLPGVERSSHILFFARGHILSRAGATALESPFFGMVNSMLSILHKTKCLTYVKFIQLLYIMSQSGYQRFFQRSNGASPPRLSPHQKKARDSLRCPVPFSLFAQKTGR